MNKEKRIFTWVLFMALILLLAFGCKKDDGPVQPKPDPIGNPEPEPDPENRPPGSFGLLALADGSENVDVLPTLSWEQATDPDGDKVVYDLYLDSEDAPANLIEENIGTTSYTLPDRLEYESEFHWRVVAKDDKGAETESGERSFTSREIAIEWQVSLGGSKTDVVNDIRSTSDGGFIAVGYSRSDDGDVGGNNGGDDFWIVRLTPHGSLVWATHLGGSKDEVANAVMQTIDGGYMVVGYSFSSEDGDFSRKNNGLTDYWIVKLDANGELDWETSLGGSSYDSARGVRPTQDGGYLVVGSSRSINGDVSDSKGDDDIWLIKLDAEGNLINETSLGGSKSDKAYDMYPTSDGNFVLAAISNSSDGDVSNNKGDTDYWILKIDGNANLIWQTNFGGSEVDLPWSITQSTDGGFVAAGSSSSPDGDISNPKGSIDYWIVKLGTNGNLLWESSLGGSNIDNALSIAQTANDDLVIAGYSNSLDGDVSHNKGGNDYWIVQLDELGNLRWEVNLGGSGEETARRIMTTQDGGLVVAGSAASSDGDVIGNNGSNDFWIVKLN